MGTPGNNRLFASGIAIAGLVLLFPQNSQSATVTVATNAVWNERVQQSKAELAQEIANPEAFLSINIADTSKDQIASIDDLAQRSPQGSMVAIPSGLIHHWKGAVLIRDARSSDVVTALQDYNSYTDIFRPAVIDSKLLSRTQDEFRYRLKMVQKGFGVKAGLLGVFRSNYYQLSASEGYSITEAIELDELENAGASDERMIPFGASHGYVEKVFTIVRYREAGRGVYVEIETLTLSRGVPGPVRWMISPAIQRFSRQTMAGTLESVRDKVRATEELAASGERPRSLEHGGW